MKTARALKTSESELFDVFGPTVQFLTPPDSGWCIMNGSIPAGVSVPSHSHPDNESFYIISGVLQDLTEVSGNFRWMELSPGDFLHINNITIGWLHRRKMKHMELRSFRPGNDL